MAEIPDPWSEVMIKKTLDMHMVQTLWWTFPHCRKASDHQPKGRKHFSPWLIWATVNVSVHRSVSVSWYLLQLLSSLAWDKRLFMVSMVLMGSVMSHKMQTSLHICSQQKLQNRMQQSPRFLLKLWIRTKVQAVSSAMLSSQANNNWL